MTAITSDVELEGVHQHDQAVSPLLSGPLRVLQRDLDAVERACDGVDVDVGGDVRAWRGRGYKIRSGR